MKINIALANTNREDLKVSDLVLAIHKRLGSTKNTLGEYLKSLSLVKNKDWELDLPLTDASFNHKYRHLFSDAKDVINDMQNINRDNLKLSIFTKIKGKTALDFIDDCAEDRGRYGFREDSLKYMIKISRGQ